MSTLLKNKVSRKVARETRDLIITLYPATEESLAEIEIREAGRRAGYRWTVSRMFTHMACQSAGVSPRGKGSRAKGI